MKKKGKWVLLLIAVVCCIGLKAYMNISEQSKDNTAPVISFQSQEIDVTMDALEADLLNGVTAWDERDGDVTAGVVIEGISSLSSDQTATVTYAAFDQAGNVAKAQRTVRYTDYHSPRFTLSAPLVFSIEETFDVFDYVGAEDVIDGSLDDRVKATLVGGDGYIYEEGVHQVQFRVTNSMKDTVYMTVPVDVYPVDTYNATLELSDYLIYVEQGSSFDPAAYLKKLQCEDVAIPLTENASEVSITYDSDVNTGIPGSYSVAYTAKSGIYTGYTRLIVIVEE